MEVEFHESYLIGVAVVLVLLCNLHGVLLCAKELLNACRELSSAASRFDASMLVRDGH